MLPTSKQWPVVLYLFAQLSSLVFSQTLQAGENKSPESTSAAADLLEFVGLTAQIDRTADTIATETIAALKKCEQTTSEPEKVGEFLRTLYKPEALAETAQEQVEQHLSAEEKNDLITWINSPTGRKVYAAESALNDADSDKLPELESALVASEQWTEERQRSIYKIVRATRIHHYVAALNTALSAAVAMGSACKTDFGSLNGIELAQQRDRADEKLLAGLMLNTFIVPTGVIMQPLSDEELQEYFLFSVTETGKKWHALVIDTARSMIVDRIPDIRSYLAVEAN